MATKEQKLENALGAIVKGLDALWDDLKDGKLTAYQIKEKHEKRVKAVQELVEDELTLPDVDFVIEVEGDATSVSVRSTKVMFDYAVHFVGSSFDPYKTYETEPFSSYEDIVDEIKSSIDDI